MESNFEHYDLAIRMVDVSKQYSRFLNIRISHKILKSKLFSILYFKKVLVKNSDDSLGVKRIE